MTPAQQGYGSYPLRSEFEENYGFDPADEACNLCPSPKGKHVNLLHTFVPAGKPVKK
jgi:hypothetical protein